jgi:HK97 family phage major capsid protein
MAEFEEIVKEVKDEITKLGDDYKASKENYTELRKNHEKVKTLVDENVKKFDRLLNTQIEKLTTDIGVRQEDLTKKIDENEAKIKAEKDALNKRIDDFEVAMKRQGGIASPEEAAKLEKNARDFMICNLAVKKQGAKHSQLKDDETDIEGFKAYKKAFGDFLRTKNDSPGAMPEFQKALSLGTDPDGGYTVTPVMSNRIIERLFEMDPMRALATIETITTDAIEWLADYDEPGGGWESETESTANTATPKFNKKRIPVHVLAARPRATQTLLEDSAINIEQWLAGKQANRFGRLEAAAFVNGDGVGKPRGFLTYPNYTTAGTDQWGAIERINMGAAAALTGDGFIDVKYALIEQYLNRASWLMNRTTVSAAMKLKDGTGEYIWKPGLSQDRHSTILGSDVRMSTTMPAVAAGALSVAIADWAETYMIVDRLGISVQRDPFTVKPYVEFYTRKRVGGDVVNYQGIKLGNIAV